MECLTVRQLLRRLESPGWALPGSGDGERGGRDSDIVQARAGWPGRGDDHRSRPQTHLGVELPQQEIPWV